MLQVQRWDADRDGVMTASRLRRRFEAQGLWVSEASFQPGDGHPSTAPAHDQLHVVLSGLMKVTIDGDSVVLGAGDTLFVPRGTDSVLEAIGAMPAVACFAAFLPAGPRVERRPQADTPTAVWL